MSAGYEAERCTFAARVINYGERYRFSHSIQKNWWRLKVGESGILLRYNINKVDVQTSKLVIIDAKNGIYGT